MSPNGVHVATGLQRSVGYIVLREPSRPDDKGDRQGTPAKGKAVASSPNEAGFTGIQTKIDGRRSEKLTGKSSANFAPV